jgi:hypothetical protein
MTTRPIGSLLLLLALAACSVSPRPAPPPGPPPGPEPAPRGFLALWLADASGRPIEGARVDLNVLEGLEDGRTNADGWAGFEGLPLGDVLFELEAAGFRPLAGAVRLEGAHTDAHLTLERGAGTAGDAWPGSLRIDGGAFVGGDGQPVLPVLVHAGDLFAQYVRWPDKVRAAMAGFRRAGYHGLRTWLTLNMSADPGNWWASKPAPFVGPEVTPDYRGQLLAFIRDAQAAGLKLHLAPGGLDDYSNAQEEALFDLVAEVMAEAGPDRIALLEGLNEARDTGDRDDAEPGEIRRLIERVRARHPGTLYALSAYTGHEDRPVLAAWTAPWQGFYLVHGYRDGRMHDKVRHIFSLGYDGEAPPVRRLGWQGEPTGPGRWVSATAGASELDDEGLALMAAMAFTARQAWNFMCSPCVIFDQPFEEMPGFFSVPRIAAALPADLMRFPTLIHGGRAGAVVRVPPGDSEARIDQALASDGRFVAIAYGPAGAYSFPVARAFEGELLHPGTGERTPIRARAGESLRLEFRHGRILIGRVQ